VTFKFTINSCAFSTYSINEDLDDFVYVIGQGDVTKYASFTPQYEGCEASYSWSDADDFALPSYITVAKDTANRLRIDVDSEDDTLN